MRRPSWSLIVIGRLNIFVRLTDGSTRDAVVVTARRTGADVTHRALEEAQNHRTLVFAHRIVAVARSFAVSSGDL